MAARQGKDAFINSIIHFQVSAHFLIIRDGAITQYISTNDRAWHAGTSVVDGRSGCNDYTIGIKLNTTVHLPYTFRQYFSLTARTRHHFPPPPTSPDHALQPTRTLL